MMSRRVPSHQSLEDLWSRSDGIGSALKDIFNMNMTQKRYMDTYSQIYNYCTAINEQPASRSGMGRSSRMRSSNMPPPSQNFVGAELYGRLSDEIKKRVKQVAQVGTQKLGPEFLKYYAGEWENYRFSVKVLNGTSHYLNRHWVSRERDERGEEPESTVYEIYDLGIIQWRELFYAQRAKQLIEEVLRVIEAERNDETKQEYSALMKTLVTSFVELGLKKHLIDKNKKVPDLAVYEEGFEKQFLAQTREFYQKESNAFLAENPVVEYLKKVQGRFDEEQRRVLAYLDKSSQNKLEKVLVDTLIRAHIQRLYDEFKQLLRQDKEEDMGRLYQLVKKTEQHRSTDEEGSILQPIREIFKLHITEQGKEAIEKVKDKAASDPKLYVDTILAVHRKYHALLTGALDNDSGFAKALDQAASDFVNNNAVCLTTRRNKSAELLAKYCDSILKKSNKLSEDIDVDKTLSEIIVVFKFIIDKDIFLEFYSKLFANRLVKESSSSDDLEHNMILKLKAESGYEFTAKLQKMFQDIALSKNLNRDFKQIQTQSDSSLDFQIKVLSTNSWPYKSSNPVKLPSELHRCRERFLAYYNNKHSGRKINWVWTQCRGDIRMQPRQVHNSYIFTVTTHQIAILVMFNQKDSIAVSEVAAETEIETDNDYLQKVLSTLLKAKLLLLKDRTLGEDEFVNMDDVLTCNDKYKSKKRKQNISMPIKSEVKQESDATVKKVEEDRGLSIQAAIVRIMKMRKKSNHQNLLAEVFEQLKARFKPQVSLVKKQIEILVEKDYLKRVENERNTYEYVA